jgi:hypothetical protein
VETAKEENAAMMKKTSLKAEEEEKMIPIYYKHLLYEG